MNRLRINPVRNFRFLNGVNKFIFIAIVLFLNSIFSSLGEAQDLKREKDFKMSNPFGVLEFLNWNHPWNNYKYSCKKDLEKVVALMKEVGAGWVRMDFLWEDIEPEQGKTNFEKYDYIVKLLTRNNIGILGLLSYSASWAGPAWNSPPYKDEYFINYISYVIERYKDKVKYWEIWNEPDDEQYFTPQDDMVRYTQLLKQVYIKAKQIDPHCQILNGGLSKSITISLKRIYKNGGKDYFDILAIHPFINPLNAIDRERAKGLYKGCLKIMKENNDENKKVWFTEIGSPGVKTPDNTNSWWLGMSPTEGQQAEWVRYIYTELIKLEDLEKVFWAFFRDCKGHWGNGIDYFGLVRWDYSLKPSFFVYKECFNNWKKSK